LVLMDLVRGVGIADSIVLNHRQAIGRGVTPNKINKFPYRNQELLRAERSERKVASCRVCNKFPYSNLGCCTAPETG